MRLFLLICRWHLSWLAGRPSRLLLIPGGLLLVLLADHTGTAEAQFAAFLPILAVATMTLGWNDSGLKLYLRNTLAHRAAPLRTLEVAGWLLPLAASLLLGEGFLLLLSQAAGVGIGWQGFATIAFLTLGFSSAMAFTRGRRQRIVVGFAGALLVLQLLMRPGEAPPAELLAPTAWPALSLAFWSETPPAFHADIYMGLSALLGVGLSVWLGRRWLGRMVPPSVG